MAQEKKKPENMFVVYNDKFVKYLAMNDIFWTTIRTDNQVKSGKVVFLYDLKHTDRINELMEQYRIIKGTEKKNERQRINKES